MSTAGNNSELTLNSAEDYEYIVIRLDKDKYPIVFKNKVEELIECGMTRSEAEKEVDGMEITLELYYQKNYGLFAVEEGAVEAGTIYSPYSKDLYEEYKEN